MPTVTSLGGALLERAAAHPGRVAVCGATGSLAYGELARAATATAGRLLASGCRPGERVGILVERHPATVVGMVASLLAGTPYVPLDPAWPRSRVEGVAREAGLAALLASPVCDSLARTLPVPTIVPLEVDLRAPVRRLPRVSGDHLAYILYTSGSTGRAKGVMQSQSNVLRHARTYARALGIGPGDRLSLVASASVDAAVMDVYGGLLSGARVVVMDPLRLASDGVAESLERAGVTIFHATPTVFRSLFADVAPGRAPSCLRLVVLGGEAVHPRDVRLFRSRCSPATRLVNNYGPSESTIALQEIIDHATPAAGGPVPIGSPVDGIDVELRVVPGEKVGEIVLIGHPVALGYWRRDDLTERAFSKLPDGRRAFETGDLARRLPGGGLEFVGRRDWRITRHGHQVDLEEVERALLDLPGVREAVVVPADDRLIAWAVVAPGSAVRDLASARRMLAPTLPGHMLPTGFVAVDALPRTATGKIDRRAVAGLPCPDPPARRPSPAPRTDVERVVEGVWTRVLGNPPRHRDEHLFACGGHSLDAARIAAQVQAALGRAVSVATVLQQPTVAALAAAVAGASPLRPSPSRAPVVGDRRRWPLAIAQERYWARAMAAPTSSELNVAVRLEFAQPVQLAALSHAAASVLRRHAALRTTFARHPGGAVQQVRAPGGMGLEVVPQATSPDSIAAKVAWTPYDLEHDPLLRLVFIPRRDRSGTLVVAWHHLVMDGWGRLEFETELLQAYRRVLDGGDPESDDGPAYHPFVAGQRWAEGKEVDRAHGLAYWQGVLAAAGCRRLRARRSRGDRSRRAATTETIATGDLGHVVLRLARRTEVSPFVLLLTTFAVEIAALADRRTVVVTTDSAGRGDPAAQRMIGMLSNLLVLPLRVDPAERFVDALGSTAEVVRAAQEHENDPLAQAITALDSGALQRYDELFPIAFFADVERPGSAAGENGTPAGEEMPPRELSRDLVVGASVAPDRVVASVSYRTRRLTAGLADALLDSYVGLLERVADSPEWPIERLVATSPASDADRSLRDAIRALSPRGDDTGSVSSATRVATS